VDVERVKTQPTLLATAALVAVEHTLICLAVREHQVRVSLVAKG
jgi:hypothetical protein